MKHTILKAEGSYLSKNMNSISELPQQNNKSQLFIQTIQPKKGHQVDRYQGPVDPVTRLRHGFGTYHYPNKNFTFEGEYEQGVKQGKGILSMSDGTKINGTFLQNQLIGPAQITYANGSSYKGELYYGEKNGQGQFVSPFQRYKGEFKDNMRHGTGTLKTRTCLIEGTFQNNKPHGEKVTVTKFNYFYEGGYSKGLKSGQGKEQSSYYEQKYTYEGEFCEDLFNGKGKYLDQSDGRISEQTCYEYEGDFKSGKPFIYPNLFRVNFAACPAGTFNEGEDEERRPKQFTNITNSEGPIEYEVEGQSQIYLMVESCYQGPEQLDPNQPTQEQIDKLVKDWQTQNKKNKNPPPMPDFSQPRMIKPDLVVIQEETKRPLEVRIGKGEIQQDEEKAVQLLKVDYRELLAKKRVENEQIKAQNAKKAEEEGAKKGGKGAAKGGQVQLKLNCFVETPSENDTKLKASSNKGKSYIDRLQFPDDTPQGNYHIIISSPFQKFGQIKSFKKQLSIKAKNVGGKKK